MAQPQPLERLNAYRELLRPCRLTVHAQMHSRPSVFCQRGIDGEDCPRCQAITDLILEDFTWKDGVEHPKDCVGDCGWVLKERA